MMELFLLVCFGATLAMAHRYTNMSNGLTEVPAGIPANTVILELDGNDLEAADFDHLLGLQLEYVFLRSNDLTTFPNLSSVGATLQELWLSQNKITIIPPDLLEMLDVLTVLFMNENLLTVFPDLSPVGDTLLALDLMQNNMENVSSDHIASLTKLLNFNVCQNYGLKLGREHLAPLADTLQLLMVCLCYGVDIGTLEDFNQLSFMDLRGLSMSQFPPLPESCDKLRYLTVRNNLLTSDAMDTLMDACTGLEELDASVNQLTSMPNITALGGNLTALILSENAISELNQDFMRAQTVMRYLDLNNNRLPEFPDMSQSGHSLEYLYLEDNLITTVDPTVSRSMVALRTVVLASNCLTAFPDFTPSGATLSTLTLYSNRLSSLEPDLLTPLVHLTSLDLHDNHFTSLPDVRHLPRLQHLLLSHNPLTHAPPPRHVVALGKLLTLDLRNTSLVHLPSLCPRAALSLQLENNSALELCSSSMAWLKQSFFSLTVTDVLCPQLGKMWSQASFAELVATPRTYQPGDVKQLLLGGRVRDRLCVWPTSGVQGELSLGQCFLKCLMDPDCHSFNYHPAQALCAAVVPDPSHTMPLMEDPEGWDFYAP